MQLEGEEIGGRYECPINHCHFLKTRFFIRESFTTSAARKPSCLHREVESENRLHQEIVSRVPAIFS